MRTILFIAIACVTALAFKDNAEIKTIELGIQCPMADEKMQAVGSSALSLNDVKEDNGLLVVFSCNTCPFVVGDGDASEGWDGRYNQVYAIAQSSKIGMILVNSNHAKRDKDDSFEAMAARKKTKGFKMDYVLDEESVLANAFGAKTTPHVFLFDKNMKLVYRGSIDDNVKSAKEVKEKYLENALTKLASGKRIKVNDTKAIGCSIKRVAK
jgi:hypothetical protein